MIIEFPEYAPDIAPLNSPGMTSITNAIPDRTHYSGIRQLTSYSNALTAYCRGFYAGKNPQTGAPIYFAGDETKLYSLQQALVSNISKVGGYALADGEYWTFAQYGNYVIAVNIDGDMQSYVIGTSSVFANLTADATKPYARHVDVVGNFVVVGNTYDTTDNFAPYRVRWSWFDNPTRWTVDAANQSDYQDLDGGNGWVNGIIGGEFGIIFQERAITTMHYVGSPAVFEFKTVEQNNGTIFPNCFAVVGNIVYFIGIDGFYSFDGYSATSIGVNKVDKTFFANINLAFVHRVTAAVDYEKKVIAFSYPDFNSDNIGTPNQVLYYNYAEKRWGAGTFDHEILINIYSEGYVMDPAAATNGLDLWQTGVQGLGAADLDQLPYSLDSRIWTDNKYELAAFNESHEVATFDGLPQTALFYTPEVQLNDGQRTQLSRLRAIVDGNYGTRTVQIGYRNLQSETVAYTGSFFEMANGDIPVRTAGSNARYQRLRMQIAFEGTATNPSFTPFENAIGVEILEQRKAGKR